ncbi:MAG: YceI family protein [Actinobacteria bacterium]|nr:MAG: YceI family protein [Actinomycetota bacterium]
MRHWKRWLGIWVVVVAVAAVGGPFVYIHFIEGSAPPPLTLSSPAGTATAGATPASGGATVSGRSGDAADGTWNVSSGSVAGYRVNEVLFGQSNTAVGRTSSISGSITVSGTSVTAGAFTVDLASVTSDQSRRDAQFNGRIMDTATYPTATFTLIEPIDFGSIPARGTERTLEVTGRLTLHGVTRAVTFEVTGRYTGSAIQVAGSIPITFGDWSIPNPSFGPVSTEDHGVLEFELDFLPA